MTKIIKVLLYNHKYLMEKTPPVKFIQNQIRDSGAVFSISLLVEIKNIALLMWSASAFPGTCLQQNNKDKKRKKLHCKHTKLR